ncbi:MAG: type II toxin-antitoxin system VapC family toxin [Candidatus Nanoarchaeia archaeon]|nr:type II toxin-antitoxin system VapC family toxin [Candidatus Nanoarchaeia archaeon]
MNAYYIDTSIWMDLIEERKGYKNEPLWIFATKLFILIKLKQYPLLITTLLMEELSTRYSTSEINGMMTPFKNNLIKINISEKQKQQAKLIAKERNLPTGDVLHAIVARDNNAILITRDKHFNQLKDIHPHFKPEDLI